MKRHTTIFEAQLYLLQQGTEVVVGNKTYYFLPFWVEVKDDNPNFDGAKYATFHSLGDLPKELTDHLDKIRYGENLP